jgi:hypothetical protein
MNVYLDSLYVFMALRETVQIAGALVGRRIGRTN